MWNFLKAIVAIVIPILSSVIYFYVIAIVPYYFLLLLFELSKSLHINMLFSNCIVGLCCGVSLVGILGTLPLKFIETVPLPMMFDPEENVKKTFLLPLYLPFFFSYYLTKSYSWSCFGTILGYLLGIILYANMMNYIMGNEDFVGVFITFSLGCWAAISLREKFKRNKDDEEK